MPGLVLRDRETAWTAPTAHGVTDTLIPPKLSGPMVWTGADFDGEVPIVELSNLDVEELETALQRFKDLHIPNDEICRATFPLSDGLAMRLENVSQTIHSGRGFAIVRGIDPLRYSSEDNLLLFAGTSSHVGDERQGMDYIYDEKRKPDQHGIQLRPPNLPVEMNFHTDTDAGDITALYIQNTARHGGDQRLASIWKVYNELRATHPEAIATLMQNWRFEVPWGNGTEVINRPLLYYTHPHLLFTFAKSFIRGSTYDKRLPDSPPLGPAQESALSLLLQSCTKHSLKLPTKKGDMLFINNLSLLHQRDSFVDDPATGHERMLLSLMLRDSRRAWDLPVEIGVFTDARFAAENARELPGFDEWRTSRLGLRSGDLPAPGNELAGSESTHSPAIWTRKHD